MADVRLWKVWCYGCGKLRRAWPGSACSDCGWSTVTMERKYAGGKGWGYPK